MTKTKSIYLASLAVLLSPISANALVIGVAETENGNCIPFGCASLFNPEYQQVYAATEFGGAANITSLSFFNTESDNGVYSLNTGVFSLYLSTTSAAVNGLSTVLADNVGADETLVYSGTAPANSLGGFGGQFDFNLISPFFYDPSFGNLLLRITYPGASGPLIYLDYDISGTVTSRAYLSRGAALASSSGLVTGFGLATSVPEPGTLALLGLGLVGMAARRRKTV